MSRKQKRLALTVLYYLLYTTIMPFHFVAAFIGAGAIFLIWSSKDDGGAIHTWLRYKGGPVLEILLIITLVISPIYPSMLLLNGILFIILGLKILRSKWG